MSPLFNLNTKGQIALPAKEKEFLFKAISYSHYLHGQISNKLAFFYSAVLPVSSNYLLAEILIKSEWGDHPLAQENYPPKTTKWSNNLALLELDESWTGKFIKYEGGFYKTFKSWEEMAVSWTDTLVFRKGNIDKFLFTNPSMEYNSLIEKYSLEEFEIGKSEDRGSSR